MSAPSSTMPWIKLHTNLLDDPRLSSLPERAQLHYFKLLILAGRLDAGGSLIIDGRKLTDQEIAWMIRLSNVDKLTADLKLLKKNGLLLINGHGWEIGGFMEFQGPTQSDKRAVWRARQEKHRTGKKQITSDKAGGHAPVTSDKAGGHAPVTPTDQNPDQRRGEEEPDQTRPESQRAGRDAKNSDDGPHPTGWLAAGFNVLSEADRKIADMALAILTSAGLGQMKSKNLLAILAARVSPSKLLPALLAGLASAYADESARKKPIVAAYRLEEDQVAAQFKNPTTWRILPEEVLRAAGIDDLDEYIRSKQPARKIFKASEQPAVNAVPIPPDAAQRVRASLKGVADAKSVR